MTTQFMLVKAYIIKIYKIVYKNFFYVIYIVSMLSPSLFSVCTEWLMREAGVEEMGVSVGGGGLTDLRCADSVALRL